MPNEAKGDGSVWPHFGKIGPNRTVPFGTIVYLIHKTGFFEQELAVLIGAFIFFFRIAMNVYHCVSEES